jgi:hypothetical protein
MSDAVGIEAVDVLTAWGALEIIMASKAGPFPNILPAKDRPELFH